MKHIYLFVVIHVVLGDPCVTHKNLTDVEIRGTGCQKLSSLICDRNNFDTGWYAAIHEGRYLQMPAQIPNIFSCGTQSPIWINGTHPTITGQSVSVKGCAKGFGVLDNCIASYNITIKKCPSFYVYHLPYVDLCFQGYCFGNHTCGNRVPITTPSSEISTSTTPLMPTDPCIYARNLPDLKMRGSECKRTSGPLCDRTLEAGWYRAIDDNEFMDMPNQCVRPASCGTEEPIWLNGSYPTFYEGAVPRTACVRGLLQSQCCIKSIDIYARNCFTYNVYYLPYTDLCFRAYCFGTRQCIYPDDENETIITNHVKSDITIPIVIAAVALVVVVVAAVVVGYFIKRRGPKVGEPPPPYSPPSYEQPTYDGNRISMNGYPQDKKY